MAEETREKPEQAEAEAPPEAEVAETQAPEAQAPEEDHLPESQVTVEDAGTLKKKVTVEIPRERIDAKFEEMFGELGRTAEVPGFRVGRAPRRLIEKRFGKEVGQDVRNAVLGDAMGSAVEKTDIKVVGEPDINLDEIELPEEGSLTFSFEVEVAPDFELPPYEGIEIRKPDLEVTDERVDQSMAQWAQSRGRLRPAGDEVRADDVVVADVAITGDGVDLSRPNVELRVAPAQVEGIPVEDLPQALIGNKAGDTCTMKTQVPSAHPQEAWRDKQVTIALTLQDVKRLEVPELDEDLARQSGFGSLEEMRQAVRSGLQSRLATEQQKAMRQQVSQFFLKSTDFEVPEGVAGRHAARLLARRYIALMMQGVPRQEIDQHMQELEAAATTQAAQDLKLTFILGKLIEKEGVEVSDAEINARIAEIARRQNRRPERLRQELTNEGTLDQLATAVGEEKAIDKVLATAKVVPAGEGEEDRPAKPTEKKRGAAKGKRGASRKG